MVPISNRGRARPHFRARALAVAVSSAMVATALMMPAASAQSSPSVTLTYANFTASTIPGELGLIQGFTRLHPNIHIKVEELPLASYETNLEARDSGP